LNSQASGAAQAYFLSVLGGASFDSGRSVASDSLDNVYVVGRTDSAGAGGADFLLAKYDNSGTILFQRVLGGAGFEQANGVAIDSANNVYVFGQTTSTGAGSSDLLLAKYNSSGTIQFQRVLGGATFDIGNAVAIDSADNVYGVGRTTSTGAGNDDFLLAKYDSSGTIQWERVLGGAANDEGFSVAIDSADNVYVVGKTASSGAGSNDFLLAKYNSSGTIQFQRTLGGASNDAGNSVAIDSADNVYVLGETGSTGAGSDDFLLAKYNSSGTIQFQRVLGGAGIEQGRSVAIDSSDNVYVLGETTSTGAGGEDFLLAKYDSSGTIQFQRVLGGTGDEVGRSVAVDSSDNVYVLGQTTSTGAGSSDFLLAKLPNDGSLEGTYSLDGSNIIYQASTLTAATSSLTAATSSLTAATASLTDAASSLTDAASTLTSVTLEI
jgi:uncharacterized delta-60 repeat protein